MALHLVCYATPNFYEGQRRLVTSATRFNIERIHCWNRQRLEQTAFYRAHRPILDLPRGSGYWLWKPYIVAEALQAMDVGDTLFYSDAGIEIVKHLSPLVALCARQGGLLLFAGHYYRQSGPNICRKWTKRDCFHFMSCDEARYHDAQMLDASFLVLMKTARAGAFVHEWLSCCANRHILTDDPNVCGLDDFPDFLDHRHDQSVLSLLAERHRLDLFRHPSQFGNHLKLEECRDPHELIRFPYGHFGIFRNSPYGTLLDHHRMGRTARVRFMRQ